MMYTVLINIGTFVGTFVGTAKYTTGYGDLGQSFLLDGSNYIDIPTTSNLDIGASESGMSISLWVKATIMGSLIEWTGGFYMCMWPDINSVWVDFGDNQVYHTDTGPHYNYFYSTWRYVVFTYDKLTGYCKFYCDGNLVATNNFGPNIRPLTQLLNSPFRIGSATFTGSLDDISLWNRPLTETDVQALYLSYKFSPTITPTVVATVTPTHTFAVNLRIFSANDKCLDIPYFNQMPGQSLQEYDCNHGANQIFTFFPVPGGHYNIKSSNGFCVDGYAPSTSCFDAICYANRYIDLMNAFGFDQYSLIRHWNNFGIHENRNPCCFTPSSLNGAIIKLYSCNGVESQLWTINDLGNNLVKIQMNIDVDHCLANDGSLATNVNPVKIGTCGSSSESTLQTWSFSFLPTTSPTSFTSINLLSNGDFSAGNTGFTSDFTYVSGPNSLIPEGVYTISTDPFHEHPYATSFKDHTTGIGNMFAANGAFTTSSVWCETISVTLNTNYSLSAWFANWCTPNFALIQFEVNGVAVGTKVQLPGIVGVWFQISVVWYSGTSNSATVCINDQQTTGNGNDFAIDDISFTSLITPVLNLKVPVYNVIPNFDFGGNNDIGYSSNPYANCNLNPTCIGYNSNGYFKNDFFSPGDRGTNFYVHAVQKGMNFVQIVGWDSSGGDMSGSFTSASATTCAYQCVVTAGCVGAVWDGYSICWLKAHFNQPYNIYNRNLLLPAGFGVCPSSFLNTDNCLALANLLYPSSSPTMLPSLEPSSLTDSPTLFPTVQPTLPLYQYLGCYGDYFNRAMERDLGRLNSVLDCYNAALSNGFAYFGLQDGGQCSGSNDLAHSKMYGTCGACNGCGYNGCNCTRKKCPNGDNNCGDDWANALYMIILREPSTQPSSPTLTPSTLSPTITFKPSIQPTLSLDFSSWQRLPALETSSAYITHAASSDGCRITIVGSGPVMTSSDCGASWTSRSMQNLGYVSMSDDGMYQLASTIFCVPWNPGCNARPLYRSANFGETWNSLDFYGNFRMTSISASGQYQAVAEYQDYGGSIRLSTNYGVTWTIITPPGGTLFFNYYNISTSLLHLHQFIQLVLSKIFKLLLFL